VSQRHDKGADATGEERTVLYLCPRHDVNQTASIIKFIDPDLVLTANPPFWLPRTPVLSVRELVHPNLVLGSDHRLLRSCTLKVIRQRGIRGKGSEKPIGFLISSLFNYSRQRAFIRGLLSTRQLHLSTAKPFHVEVCCDRDVDRRGSTANTYTNDWSGESQPLFDGEIYKFQSPLEETTGKPIPTSTDALKAILQETNLCNKTINIWSTYDRLVDPVVEDLVFFVRNLSAEIVIHTSERFVPDFINSRIALVDGVRIASLDASPKIETERSRHDLSGQMGQVFGVLRSLYSLARKRIFSTLIRASKKKLFLTVSSVLDPAWIKFKSDKRLFHSRYVLGQQYAEKLIQQPGIHVFLNLRWPEFVGARQVLEISDSDVYGVQLVLHARDNRYLLPRPKHFLAVDEAESLSAIRLDRLLTSNLTARSLDEERKLIEDEYRNLIRFLCPIRQDIVRDFCAEREPTFVGQGFPGAFTTTALLAASRIAERRVVQYCPHPTENPIVTEMIVDACGEFQVDVVVAHGVARKSSAVYFGLTSNVLRSLASDGFSVVQFHVPHVDVALTRPFITGENVLHVMDTQLLRG